MSFHVYRSGLSKRVPTPWVSMIWSSGTSIECLSMPVVWVVIHPEKAGPKSSSLDSSHGQRKHHPSNRLLIQFSKPSLSAANCRIFWSPRLWITKIWIWGSPRPTPACHLAHYTGHWIFISGCWQLSSFVPQLSEQTIAEKSCEKIFKKWILED